jgi:dTDP-4-amino-4,6-dideoxy-D-galactose acyltransferase
LRTWCDHHSIDCLYFLADSDSSVATQLAEDNGFQLVDVRITLEVELDGRLNENVIGDVPNNAFVRSVRPDDILALHQLAHVNHRDTRFYYDPAFSTERCHALYETWIERSCDKYADAVLVAEFAGAPVGCVSCHVASDMIGRIGLFGVAPDCQGTVLGGALVSAAKGWFAKHGMARITVATQGRNCKAQRLYQRHGFLTQSVQLWYHWWLNAAEVGNERE